MEEPKTWEPWEELAAWKARAQQAEARVAEWKKAVSDVSLESSRYQARVAELEREGCGGDPHCDCYVPAAHPDAEEGA